MARTPPTEHAKQREQRVEQRLAIPVLVAALASVPAVFLTLMDGAWEQAGTVINSISGAVLVAETVVLFVVSTDKRTWLRKNWWLIALAVAVVLAVIFAIGPVQLLRLVRVVGALRIVRVKRIFKAGAILRERYGMNSRWQKAITGGVAGLCAGFVVVVLADPTSQSGQWARTIYGTVGPIGVLIAGAIMAGATLVVARREREDKAINTDNDTGNDTGNGPGDVRHTS